MQKDIEKQVTQATKWSSITEILAKIVSPLVNMILARLLTPEAFGAVATITMIISFAEIFTDAGFQKYIIQHEFEDDNELNNSTNVAFWTNLCISVLICIMIFIFRKQIAILVGSAGLGDSISISSVLIIIAAFSSIQMARYKRDFDFKTLFYVRMGTISVPLLITVPLAFIMRNYWAILIGNFSSQLFNAVVLTVKSKWKPSFYYKLSLLKKMFSFSAWTIFESISIWLTNYIGVFIVGNFLNEYYLGIYKTSMSTVNSYMGIITSAITPILFSALSRYQNDDVNFKKTFLDMQRLVAIMVFPMGVGIFLFQDLVTRILLGSQWLEASGFIGLWGLTSAFAIVFSHFSSEVFRSKGNPKLSLALQLIHLLFVIPILLICVKYDFSVLYIARSLVRIQMIITALIFMKICYQFNFLDMFINVVPMIISSFVMGAAGYWLQKINNHILWQFASVIICIVVYFVILFWCFPKIRKEITEMFFIKKSIKKLFKTNMKH